MKTKEVLLVLALVTGIVLQHSCIKKEILSLPEVTTDSIYNITLNSATAKGAIKELGTETGVSQHGHVWSAENTTPTTNDEFSSLGLKLTEGKFESLLTELDSVEEYFLRAYATNNVGTSYGELEIFTTHQLPNVQIDSVF